MPNTGSTVVNLGIDPTTGLEKRAVFKQLICSEETKWFTVYYDEQILSPNGTVVNSTMKILQPSSGEYEQFDALIGPVIRAAVENGIKNKYGIPLD